MRAQDAHAVTSTLRRGRVAAGFAAVLAAGCGRAPVVAPKPERPPVSLAIPAPGDSTRLPRGQRFYHGLSYGSESQFSPLTQLVNEGFNNLGLESYDRRVFRLPYAQSARNLGYSLAHVQRAYGAYGWPRAVRNEILPLTAREGGQWVPNYQDHLVGSGMVSARLAEWYEAHGYAHPAVRAYLTMTASHVLNEIVERPQRLSVDALTDLLLFDNLGFVVFRSERVQRLFSGRVRFTNWPGQPTLNFPDETLENTGQEFVLRFPLPRTQRWRGMYFYGLTNLLGVSRDIGDGRSVSAGLGPGVSRIDVTDASTDTRTVQVHPMMGLFYDRNGSLLASLLSDDSKGTLFSLNVYPGLVRIAGITPGAWLAVRKDGGVRFGLAAPFGLGLGHSPPMHP